MFKFLFSITKTLAVVILTLAAAQIKIEDKKISDHFGDYFTTQNISKLTSTVRTRLSGIIKENIDKNKPDPDKISTKEKKKLKKFLQDL